MDNFRWILLAAGILIIVIIYMISRKNKREFYRDDEDLSEDLPEINTRGWDDLDEGVGEVRIVARSNNDITLHDDEHPGATSSARQHEEDTVVADDHDYAPVTEEMGDALLEIKPKLEPEPEPVPDSVPVVESKPAQEADTELTETVLVFNILARDGSTLAGKSINSVAHANDLVYGEMNIYHRLDEANVPVFSMINMVKPGSFDPSTIHELNTPGISLFMQLPGPSNASEAFDVMLQTAYRMSETLEARLCDRSRQPMTESVVEEYRNTAASFDGKS